jgi:hypothetical protein
MKGRVQGEGGNAKCSGRNMKRGPRPGYLGSPLRVSFVAFARLASVARRSWGKGGRD